MICYVKKCWRICLIWPSVEMVSFTVVACYAVFVFTVVPPFWRKSFLNWSETGGKGRRRLLLSLWLQKMMMLMMMMTTIGLRIIMIVVVITSIGETIKVEVEWVVATEQEVAKGWHLQSWDDNQSLSRNMMYSENLVRIQLIKKRWRGWWLGWLSQPVLECQ